MTNLATPSFVLPSQPDGMKHRFHAMVKPIGSLCNLNCTYCYYLHKEALLHQSHAPRMSDEMLEQHIRQYIEAQTGDTMVFSCDHYVYPEYRIGNISEIHIGAMAYSNRQKAFGFAKRDTLTAYCRQCPHLKLCWGECPKNRILRTPEGETGLNYLCPGLKKFYSHIQRDMPDILNRIQKKRSPNI